MAEIVILNRWRGHRGSRRAEIRIGMDDDVHCAKLLMFTGVRYERLEEKSTPQSYPIGVVHVEHSQN